MITINNGFIMIIQKKNLIGELGLNRDFIILVFYVSYRDTKVKTGMHYWKTNVTVE